MGTMSMLPMLGNLAWAPVPAIESVEVLDRFNGVPTFGLFSVGGERQLFWRISGYVPQSMSIWLYLPLTASDENRLATAEPSEFLAGLVFQASEPRYATIGVATDYRLVFEREWRLPENAHPQTLLPRGSLDFLVDALTIALPRGHAPSAQGDRLHRVTGDTATGRRRQLIQGRRSWRRRGLARDRASRTSVRGGRARWSSRPGPASIEMRVTGTAGAQTHRRHPDARDE